jgi:hypothetical protein
MASVDAQALQQDRQGDRGSDETSLQERRRIQKLIRTGDEHVIPELINSLSTFLGAKTVEQSKGHYVTLPPVKLRCMHHHFLNTR